MKVFLVKQVDRKAWVHAVYPTLDEAWSHCLVHTRAHEGSETSWWVLSTDRVLGVNQDVDPCF